MLSPGLERGRAQAYLEGEALAGSFISGELREMETIPLHGISSPLRCFQDLEWEAAVEVWLAGDVHCLAPRVVPSRGPGFGLVQGLKHWSKGSSNQNRPSVSLQVSVLSALSQ